MNAIVKSASPYLHRAGLAANRVALKPFLKCPKMIMLFGVMRSGTTLLTEIMVDNPEIAGFGEAHVAYRDKNSLCDLYYWIARFTGKYPARGQYVFDKVLHEKHLPDVAALTAMTDLHPIFILREPQSNARSLTKMFERQSAAGADVWAYLLKRYEELQRLRAALPPEMPVAVLSYEKLVNDPEDTLTGLSQFLDLNEPLREDYGVSPRTGRWGTGDGSSAIKAGKIIRPTAGADETSSINTPENVTQQFGALKRDLAKTARVALL